jgi:hypothetical protein
MCAFYTIWSVCGLALYDEHDLVRHLEEYQNDAQWNEGPLKGCVDIGYAEGDRPWLCLDCDGQTDRGVSLADVSMSIPNPVLKVADSLSEFLALFGNPGRDI